MPKLFSVASLCSRVIIAGRLETFLDVRAAHHADKKGGKDYHKTLSKALEGKK